MKEQSKQYSEEAACFGHMTTGMSGPKFLISVPNSSELEKTSVFSPFKSYETETWLKAHIPLLNNNVSQV